MSLTVLLGRLKCNHDFIVLINPAMRFQLPTYLVTLPSKVMHSHSLPQDMFNIPCLRLRRLVEVSGFRRILMAVTATHWAILQQPCDILE